jgi:uncharacterized RDD family membrane protein YckC
MDGNTVSTNTIQTPYIQSVTLPSGSFKLASGFKRWVASVVDGIIQGVPIIILVISFAVLGDYLDQSTSTSDDLIGILVLLACCGLGFAVLGIMYFVNAYWPSINNGQTFGKKLLGIKVIDEYGNNPTFSKHFLRYTLHLVLANIIGPIAYVTIIFHDKKQAVYDLIVNTFVVEA